MVDMPPAALVFLRNQRASDTERLSDTLARVAVRSPTNLGLAGVLELRLLAAQGAAADEMYREARQLRWRRGDRKRRSRGPTVIAEAPADIVRGILDGTVSPQQADPDGAVTLQGNVDLVRRIIVRLAAAGAARSVCPSITDEAYFAIRRPAEGARERFHPVRAPCSCCSTTPTTPPTGRPACRPTWTASSRSGNSTSRAATAWVTRPSA